MRDPWRVRPGSGGDGGAELGLPAEPIPLFVHEFVAVATTILAAPLFFDHVAACTFMDLVRSSLRCTVGVHASQACDACVAESVARSMSVGPSLRQKQTNTSPSPTECHRRQTRHNGLLDQLPHAGGHLRPCSSTLSACSTCASLVIPNTTCAMPGCCNAQPRAYSCIGTSGGSPPNAPGPPSPCC